MPGDLAKMQLRGRGAKGEVPYGAQEGKMTLPIFRAPVFSGHGVTNPRFLPGLAKGDFKGEDEYGWGAHHKGLVDCVNLKACRSFSLLHNQDWPTLWELEHNEDVNGNLEPVADFLQRIIVMIRLDRSSVKRIPNPEIWDVEVELDSGFVVSGSKGSLVLKSRPSKDNEAVRDTFYMARKVFPDFTESSQPWVTNR